MMNHYQVYQKKKEKEPQSQTTQPTTKTFFLLAKSNLNKYTYINASKAINECKLLMFTFF